jgi:hypothetical protein
VIVRPSQLGRMARSRDARCHARSRCEAAEHGRRATRRRVVRDHVPANAPGRIEGRYEHPRPCSRALSRHEPRRLLRPRREAATTWSCAHATRAVAPAPSRRWQTRHSPRRSPRRMREPPASRIAPLPSVLPGPSRDARRNSRREHVIVRPSQLGRMARSRDARCHARSRCEAAEHGRRATRRRVIRDHVPANAPGRIEGRREHPRPCSRAARRHEPRRLLRPRREAATTWSCAHATRAVAPAPSRRWQTRHSPRRPPSRRREPRPSRIRPLPSVLPGPSRAPRTKPASNATGAGG